MPYRRFVGVYDRPSPLRRRQAWLPLVVAVIALATWFAFFVIP